ncbi:MAG: serine hydrolase [Proteobacteria bacterium]|nr:serine hydrolase [Pseudomonadota bacterium]
MEVEDLKYYKVITAQVDFAKQSASASLFGLVKRTAVYNPEMGCRLVYGDIPNTTVSTRPHPNPNAVEFAAEVGRNKPAPAGVSGKLTGQMPETVVARPYSGLRLSLNSTALPNFYPMGVSKLGCLDTVLDWAFAEPDPKHKRRTRAVVILRDGRIVAERYAPGFDQDMPLPGWSMAKGVVNALVGILVGRGKLNLDAPAAVPEWQGIDDPRREITLDQLMRMTSGLEFTEKSNNPLYDLTKMLLTTPDSAAYAANKPLHAKPGTHWRYASGTTNIISRIIRSVLGEADYRQFPHRALFGPLGMGSAMFECDASGTFVGSSFLYATARDWAKFGQLYCQEGVLEGKRILPSGWVGYSTTPSASDRQYGAHFWLDIQQKKNCPDREAPLPADAFHAMGYEGQCVSIMPSQQLVVVRLGLTRKSSVWQQDCFLNLIIDALAGTAEFR